MDIPSELFCPHCKNVISDTDYFCPSCGKKLKEKPPSTTIAKQIAVYATSFFLPPLGLWPAILYMKSQDKTAKKIGLAALFLTLISILISVWITSSLINSVNTQLNSQLNSYR